jgi:VIT1/CCC1 family predicted Fe2+/Mn2+ transporter
VAPPVSWRVPTTFLAMVAALSVPGWVSAGLGYAPRPPAVARNVLGEPVAMVVTYGVGLAVGTQV